MDRRVVFLATWLSWLSLRFVGANKTMAVSKYRGETMSEFEATSSYGWILLETDTYCSMNIYQVLQRESDGLKVTLHGSTYHPTSTIL